LFPREATYYFCAPDIPRGLDVSQLKEAANRHGLQGEAFSSVQLALDAARKNASADDLIYVGGSTFVVAEII
jgi:dihydrofolate synthase/folylpolyglutamate synthase